MDKNTLQQIEYLKLIWSMTFRSPSIWNFSVNAPGNVKVTLGNGNIVSANDLIDYGVSSKRNGDYASALGAYMRVISAQKEQLGYVTITPVTSIIKVLICLNRFALAFDMTATTLADMQQKANNTINFDKEMYQNVNNYFNCLQQLAFMVVDKNDFTAVLPFASNFSGSMNYSLQEPRNEIFEEFKYIRDRIRKMTGK